MARDEKLMIRLEEKTKWEFQRLADRYGVTMSALGAVILGQWVDQQREAGKVKDMLMVQAGEGLKEQLAKPITDEQFEALQKSAPGFIELIRTLAEDSMKS